MSKKPTTIRTSRHDSNAMPGRKIPKTSARSYCIYGRSGTGKTTLAGSFPTPILYLDIRDRGTDSIIDVKGVEIRQLDTFADFEDMYWWLKKNPDEYETVVVDTVTQLQQMLLRDIALDKNKDPSKAGDWGSMTKKDWGEVTGAMKEVLTNYRDLTDLGMNIVFLAQDRVFGGEDDDADRSGGMIVPEVGPAVTQSIAKALNAAVSFIGNTFLREKKVEKEVRGKKSVSKVTEYCLRIGPNAVYATKIRKPKGAQPPSYIVDPSYKDIIAIIRGE